MGKLPPGRKPLSDGRENRREVSFSSVVSLLAFLPIHTLA